LLVSFPETRSWKELFLSVMLHDIYYTAESSSSLPSDRLFSKVFTLRQNMCLFPTGKFHGTFN
jgi:hypothetical protein